MNLSDPMYKMVVEPIMERIMEANEIGREYAERYICDTVESAVNDEIYYVQMDVASLNETIVALDERVRELENQQNNKSWLSRLLGR